jgi:hypothetical protein
MSRQWRSNIVVCGGSCGARLWTKSLNSKIECWLVCVPHIAGRHRWYLEETPKLKLPDQTIFVGWARRSFLSSVLTPQGPDVVKLNSSYSS